MRRTGVADLPLHYGKCPRWLFPLMRDLSGKIADVIVDEYGEDEFLRRLSDPYWFQAFGCVIGFDWHSSGLTTTSVGALKESLRKLNIGIGVVGGKGKASKIHDEFVNEGDRVGMNESKLNEVKKASVMSAKVDNSLVQDGYRLYHHSIIFSAKNWAVVQQGMNKTKYARRYHWLSSSLKRFVEEPHSGIISDSNKETLNLTSSSCEDARNCSVDLVLDNPIHLRKYFTNKGQTNLSSFESKSFIMSSRHFPQINANMKNLMKAYEIQPKNYEDLMSIKGIGAKSLRALALISHLVYGSELCWNDPCRYSFAHGGKDGWPYPVDREVFGKSIEFLRNAVSEAKIGNRERFRSMKRLDKYYKNMLKI